MPFLSFAASAALKRVIVSRVTTGPKTLWSLTELAARAIYARTFLLSRYRLAALSPSRRDANADLGMLFSLLEVVPIPRSPDYRYCPSPERGQSSRSAGAASRIENFPLISLAAPRPRDWKKGREKERARGSLRSSHDKLSPAAMGWEFEASACKSASSRESGAFVRCYVESINRSIQLNRSIPRDLGISLSRERIAAGQRTRLVASATRICGCDLNDPLRVSSLNRDCWFSSIRVIPGVTKPSFHPRGLY